MFKKKRIHKNMADVNVYTSRRLSDMAGSLSVLAKAFEDEINQAPKLTKEDGLAAMQTAAAMVCGSCNKCNLYSDSQKEDSYYLYYLIRSFEQKKRVESQDMPRFFTEMCDQQDAYIGYLNKNLGRATMNLAWKNRFLESRDAVVVQFQELAVILEEFSRQMEQAMDITTSKEEAIRRLFRYHHMQIENMLILEYDNHRKEAFITVRTTNGRCITAKDAAQYIAQAMDGCSFSVAKDSKTIITKQSATIHFIEDGSYHMIHGIARVAKHGEVVSGDNYTFGQCVPGQVLMSLSDGMGSGVVASDESRQIIELTEQLLETGFSQRAALKLVNTVFLLTGMEQHPATMDLCCIDLHTGILESMKLGAAVTFILGDDGVEVLEAQEVPMGILSPIEPALLSKKLWDNHRIIMISDGILDSLPGEEKEVVLRSYLEQMPLSTPQEMADEILKFASSFGTQVRDDMTVLVAGIWKRR